MMYKIVDIMRKMTIILLIAFSTGCGQKKSMLTYDNGIVINKVKWATRNIDEVGSFTTKPENTGKFYQWNRKKEWNGTDKEAVNWDDSYPVGTEWKKVNDPSPKGWRLPTAEELKSLLDIDKVENKWTIENGVKGRKFTCKETGNSIFLPAVGGIGGTSGVLLDVGELGGYWSSTESGNLYAEYLFIDINKAEIYGFSRRFGKSIRPVAE